MTGAGGGRTVRDVWSCTPLLELGQHPALAPLAAAALPRWIARVPVLDHLTAYCLGGTFDRGDLFASGVGAIGARAALAVRCNRVGESKMNRYFGHASAIWRALCVTACVGIGIVINVGCGGGSPSTGANFYCNPLQLQGSQCDASISQPPQDTTVHDGEVAIFKVVVASVAANPVSVTWQVFDAQQGWITATGCTGPDPFRVRLRGKHCRRRQALSSSRA